LLVNDVMNNVYLIHLNQSTITPSSQYFPIVPSGDVFSPLLVYDDETSSLFPAQTRNVYARKKLSNLIDIHYHDDVTIHSRNKLLSNRTLPIHNSGDINILE